MKNLLLTEADIEIIIEQMTEVEVDAKEDIEMAVEMRLSPEAINVYHNQLSRARKIINFLESADESGDSVFLSKICSIAAEFGSTPV